MDKTVSVRIDKKLHRILKSACMKEGRTVTWVLNEAIKNWLAGARP